MSHRTGRLVATVMGIALATHVLAIPARAVYGGESALESPMVVSIMQGSDPRLPGCSGALITDRIVLSAAHCFAKSNTLSGELKGAPGDYWVTQPGVDTQSDVLASRVRVLEIVIRPDYINTWNPAVDDRRTTIHDIAFLFLDRPLVPGYDMPVATHEQVLALKASRATIRHFGYGLQDKNSHSGKPFFVDLQIRPRTHIYELTSLTQESWTIITEETGDKALCGGDSGGPWYAQIDGRWVLVANTVGASGCGGPGSGRGGTFGTLVHPYLEMMQQRWQRFLTEESILRQQQQKADTDASKTRDQARADGTLHQAEGCHSKGIVAVLQAQSGSSWVDVAATRGWADVAVCPATNPAQPWTVYDAQPGTSLRWRFSDPGGSWEVYSALFAAPAKPAPSPTPSPTASPTASTTPAPSDSATPTRADRANQRFGSCTAMWRSFPGGIARSPKARNRGTALTRKPYVSGKGYSANSRLDVDRDGLVCER